MPVFFTGTCFIAFDWYTMVFRNVRGRPYPARKSQNKCVYCVMENTD